MENNFLSFIMEEEDSDDEFLGALISSDDEDGIIAATFLKRSRDRGPLHRLPRIENYVEKVVPLYSRELFKSHFRMYPETMECILGLIGPMVSRDNQLCGRKPIDAKKQLLLTLWVMSTPDSYRSICEKFNVGKATAIRTVRRVSNALYRLAPRFIVWPTGSRALEVSSEFEKYSAFPGAVCTWNMLFTSVFAGNAGSVHDARVFRLSPVNDYMGNKETYFPNNMHLLGDAAYGIHPCLMVPFKDNGHLTQRQKNYNFCLSSARMSIERSFGLWKVRFRSILDCLPMVTINKIPEYLLATAVLHNICILNGDMIEVAPQLRLTRRGTLIAGEREEGIQKRQVIANNLIIRHV